MGWTKHSLEKRWAAHQRGRRDCYLHRCIRKYGKDHFAVEAIQEFEEDAKAKAKEVELIRELKLNVGRFPDGIGMNMTDGGEGTVGYVFTESHRKKISAAGMGRKLSAEHIETLRKSRQGTGNPMYGRPPTERQRESARRLFKERNPHKKGRLSHRYGKPGHMRGRKHSSEARRKISTRLRGQRRGPRTEETKAKLSIAVRRRWLIDGHPCIGTKRSLESRMKMRAARIAHLEKQKAAGIVYRHSEETKRKQSLAAKRRASKKPASPAAEETGLTVLLRD